MKWQTIFLSLITGLLFSCNQEAQLSEASTNTKQAHYITKPAAAVMMSYEVLSPVELNKMTDIKLSFKVGRYVEALLVNYHVEPGLSMLTEQTEYQFQSLVKGADEEIILEVVPVQAGKRIIHIYTEVTINGVKQSRAFVVSLSVASDSTTNVRSKTFNNTLDTGGHYQPESNVISMPAEQSN